MFRPGLKAPNLPHRVRCFGEHHPLAWCQSYSRNRKGRCALYRARERPCPGKTKTSTAVIVAKISQLPVLGKRFRFLDDISAYVFWRVARVISVG